jgi:serralysin
MCFLCNATQTFDPLRHGEDSGQDFATISEGLDASDSTATAYSMSVGDTFNGSIGNSSDEDWVAITLTAGETYRIDLTGSFSGNGTLSDPLLRLHSSSGTQITSNDDGGAGRESLLIYTANTSGTYYLVADAYSFSTGTYTLSVATSQPPEVASLDEMADFLTDGYWQGTFRSGRNFDTSVDNQITVNITGLTAAGQQLARWAFEAWERVANLEFVETTSSSAKITFDDAASGAYAQSVVSGGTILSSEVNVSTSWLSNYGTDIDTYSFQTYVHEIGHALGLGHQGAYNGNATYGTDETFINDSWQLSIMSYFDQDDNTTTNASFGYIVSTMMADIVAIQNLYGAPDEDSETAGDTTWGANTTLTGSYLYDIFGTLEGRASSNLTGNNFALTIYDVSGTDTIDLSPNTTNDRIDLNDESFSDVAGRIGNLGIARDTVIENVIAGSGNDTITGNEVGNKIIGRQGWDQIFGGGGQDRLFGGGGSDTLEGGIANDRLSGGGGHDSMLGESGADRLFGNRGRDTLDGGTGDDRLFGEEGHDRLIGDTGNDRLFGASGRDTLDGGAGDDVLFGGDQADYFVFDIGYDADRVRDFGLGDDKLMLSTALTGGLDNAQDVIDTFATVSNGHTILDFGNGDTIELRNYTDLGTLADDIVFA